MVLPPRPLAGSTYSLVLPYQRTDGSDALAQGVQVEEDPEDFGTQGKTHRVKKTATEKAKKST